MDPIGSDFRPADGQPEHEWQTPPARLPLSNTEVHIWRIHLDQPEKELQRLAELFSPAEREQAQRFHFERDRRRYVISHAAQRMILGQYLGVDPKRLQFRMGVRGKPCLAEEWNGSNLEFNLSHSGELALLAFTLRRAIGVDVEYMKLLPEAADIAQRFFSAYENAVWAALPASQKRQGFFNCWTRKEAFIKATGEGLYLPLDQFDVALAPGEPARLLQVRSRMEDAADWSLRELHPGTEYAGAVVVEGNDWQLHCWEWTPSQTGL